MVTSMKQYICIDLKSFYASVECVDRGLDPLTTNLVVADPTRTEKTICLAVTPSLKAYGIPGRARLFEVVQRVHDVNNQRLRDLKQKIRTGEYTVRERVADDGSDLSEKAESGFSGKSCFADELDANPALALDYITAPPQMRRYMEFSNQIVEIYLRYIAPEDIHIYSIDEVFMDVTAYLKNYNMTAHELAMKMVREVLDETGITATAGIGTNLFIAKVAMDVVAKKMPADADGVRVAELNEITFREQLWDHRPITDIWRVGRGYSKRLAEYGMHTLGDVAKCSLTNEELLYKLFGVNAELLIDHAWGYEPTEIRYIREYRPENNSLGSGQVLKEPYTYDKAQLITREMTELLVLDLVKKRLVTDQMVLTINYDVECLTRPEIKSKYHGEIVTDHYGRKVPKHAHGTANLDHPMSSTKQIMAAVMDLYERIVNPDLLVRRVNIAANHVVYEGDVKKAEPEKRQLTLLDDISAEHEQIEKARQDEERERRLQNAVLAVQERYGKNALLKGMNLQEGATTIERNG
ncbi:MAG: DNA methylase, partial [Eubacterium sp.]|nr:DNA methylase [Eubacterium sp.]